MFTTSDIEHLRWTCIHLISGTSYTGVVDTSVKKGRVINVYAGHDSVGSFSGVIRSVVGGVFMTSSKDVTKSCLGCKPWLLCDSR